VCDHQQGSKQFPTTYYASSTVTSTGLDLPSGDKGLETSAALAPYSNLDFIELGDHTSAACKWAAAALFQQMPIQPAASRAISISPKESPHHESGTGVYPGQGMLGNSAGSGYWGLHPHPFAPGRNYLMALDKCLYPLSCRR